MFPRYSYILTISRVKLMDAFLFWNRKQIHHFKQKIQALYPIFEFPENTFMLCQTFSGSFILMLSRDISRFEDVNIGGPQPQNGSADHYPLWIYHQSRHQPNWRDASQPSPESVLSRYKV